MLDTINTVLGKIDSFVWGIPLIALILLSGLFLTIRLKGIQFRKLPHAFKKMFANEKSGQHGEVSSFAALCTALSATIGTGNIVGVATAVVAGGPGALFWMWLAALVGMATKYSECLLSVKYRQVTEDGHIIGGGYGFQIQMARQDICGVRSLCRTYGNRNVYTGKRYSRCRK